MSSVAAELKALAVREPPLTLAAAESLTCGHVQTLIGSVSGASEYFVGGVTAYTLEMKAALLRVDRAAAKRVNAVSAAVATAMAQGACRLFGSDLAVATTGYAEPTTGVRTPFAWWGIAHARRHGRGFIAVRSGRVICPGADRIQAQTVVAEAVLAELVAYLQGFRQANRAVTSGRSGRTR